MDTPRAEPAADTPESEQPEPAKSWFGRPYVAVIRDSFYEAMATRVLWVTLGLIVVLLTGLAPFGFHQTIPVALHWPDLRDPQAFFKTLVAEADSEESAAGYVFNRLPDHVQEEVREVGRDAPQGRRMRLAGQVLNQISRELRKPDFYDEDIFGDLRLNAEARELKDRGLASLSLEETARFNRLVFDAAFPDLIEPAGSEAILFTWLWYPVGSDLPINESQLQRYGQILMTQLVSRLIGNVGIFIALLVTASIIPQMLDSGAIDLLLSKPVSRSMLFLSRFAGGCIFILLNATVLIFGLWLIFGIRFSMWNHGLLWTIPVFVFVFAIYFSVSALAGVIWKNSIVSIVVSILFWFTCFAVGVTRNTMDNVFLNARRAETIIITDDALLMTTRDGTGYQWSDDSGSWLEVFRQRRRGGPPGSTRGYPLIGPVFDEEGDRLIAVSTGGGNRFWRGSPKLVSAPREVDWKAQESIDAPTDTKRLTVLDDGTLIALTSDGLYRLAGDLDVADAAVEILGFAIPQFGAGVAEFERIDQTSPEKEADFEWRSPVSGDVESSGTRAVVIAGGHVGLFRGTQDGFELKATRTIAEGEASVSTIVGDVVVVAWQNGDVQILNATTLETRQSLRPFGSAEPRSLVASDDGRYAALLSHDRRLWLYDTSLQVGFLAPVSGQRDISAVSFDESGSMFVSDRFGRVIEYSTADSITEVRRFEPEPDLLENIYTLAVSPFYSVFPKPGEMENVVTWLLTQQKTISSDENTDDLTAERTVLNIQEPLWSNLAFLAAMLGGTCLFISRKDF